MNKIFTDAKNVVDLKIAALKKLKKNINSSFIKAVKKLQSVNLKS
jgi:hypothetical protein